MEFYQRTFRAMGCEMAAWVVAADARMAEARLVAVQTWIETAEGQLSRFRPESELSRLNERSGEMVAVSPLLWDLLVYALEAARRTDGLYDPTVLDALERAGYDRPFAEIGTSQAVGSSSSGLVSAPRSSAWREIRLDPKRRRVRLPAGVRLDLGGVAKGWVADRAAARLAALGPCLVDAGGDIAVRGAPPGQSGWLIGVADPHHPERDLALITLADGGVATSGTDYRRWYRDGVLQHHIIDPRTGHPAQTDLVSVTVVAAEAAQADVEALVVLLLGAEQGRRYLQQRPWLEALLIGEDGRQWTTPQFHRFLAIP